MWILRMKQFCGCVNQILSIVYLYQFALYKKIFTLLTILSSTIQSNATISYFWNVMYKQGGDCSLQCFQIYSLILSDYKK